MRTTILAALTLGLGACCAAAPTPRVAVATGARGAYVRAIPADGATPADARSGLVDAPHGATNPWPPAIPYADCTPGQDELREFEQSLGATSTACPSIQIAPVAAVGDAPTGPHEGFNVYCYPLGPAVVVVETTEMLGLCKHIVGLAVFKKQ